MRTLGLIPGGHEGRVTRRGFVFGAVALVATAALGRPAFATQADDDPRQPAVQARARLILEGDLACLFGTIDGAPAGAIGSVKAATFSLENGKAPAEVVDALTAWRADTEKVSKQFPGGILDDKKKEKQKGDEEEAGDPSSKSGIGTMTNKLHLEQWAAQMTKKYSSAAQQNGLTGQKEEQESGIVQLLAAFPPALRDFALIVRAPNAAGELTATTYRVTDAALGELTLGDHLPDGRIVEQLVFVSQRVEVVNRRKVNAQNR